MNKKYAIGIVGYGDFTKVITQWLSPFADIMVSTRQVSEDILPVGVRFGDVAEVLSQPIIIPSIPAQFLEQFFTDYRDLINPTALVSDVCSVKVRPLEVLQNVLPETCQIIGTHPMFGPASIARNGGIVSLPCALCPVRAPQSVVDELRHLLTDVLQLRVIDTTPEQHDREMAYVQGLSHYIGRVMDEMQIPDSQLQTAAYEDLLDMKRIQGGDSWDLFRSIVHENPYAQQVNTDFIAACERVSHRVGLINDRENHDQ